MVASISDPPANVFTKKRKWLVRSIVGTLFSLLVLFAWLAGTETGLRTLFGAVAWGSGGAVNAENVRGRLLGPIEVGMLRFDTIKMQIRLHDLHLDWQPSALVKRQLVISVFNAARVETYNRAPSLETTPLQPPSSLAIPVTFKVESFNIGEFEAYGQTIASDLQAPFLSVSQLNACLESDGERHHFQHLKLETPIGFIEGDGEIAISPPFRLSAQLTLAGTQGKDAYRFESAARGTLTALTVLTRMTGMPGEGQAEFEIAPFEHMPVLKAQIKAQAINPSLFNARAPEAFLQLEAELSASETKGGQGDWALAGPLAIVNQRPMTLDQSGLPVEHLKGDVYLNSAQVRFDRLDLKLPGKGRIGGQLAWQQAALNKGLDLLTGRLEAALRLEGIDSARLDRRLPSQAIAGVFDATADEQHQQIALKLDVGKAHAAIQGRLRMRADVPYSAWEYALSGNLQQFDPHVLYLFAPAGHLNLEFETKGRLAAPFELTGHFKLNESDLQKVALKGEGEIQMKDARFPVVAMSLDAGGNRFIAEGAWGEKGDQLHFLVDAMALNRFGKAFGGRFKIEGKLEGNADHPAGEVAFFADELKLPGISIAAATGQGQFGGGEAGKIELTAGVTDIHLESEKGALIIDALSLKAEGVQEQHQVDFFAGQGKNSVGMRLEGGLLMPCESMCWQGVLSDFVTTGRLPLTLQAPATLKLGMKQFELGAAEFVSSEQGKVWLEQTRWLAGEGIFRGHFSGVGVDFVSQKRARSESKLVLGAQWDVSLGKTVTGEAQLFWESGDLVVENDIRTELGLEKLDFHLAARQNQLALSFDVSGRELGQFSGSVSTLIERIGSGWRLAPDAVLAGSAHLAIPSIAWLGRMQEKYIETGGRLEADLQVSGTLSRPIAKGHITGEELQIAWVDQGVLISGGEMLAEFDHDRLRLVKMIFSAENRVRPREARIPLKKLVKTPGILKVSGELLLSSGEGHFDFIADRFPLLQQPERWLLMSGEGQIRSGPEQFGIEGVLRADAGYVELADIPPPGLSDDVVVVGREVEKTTLPDQTKTVVQADVRIDLGQALYLRGLGLDARLEGGLRLVQKPNTALVAMGTVETVDGRYHGYGQNLTIARGQVVFHGDIDNPALNIIALRKGLPVEAGVAISGRVSRPEVQLISDPSVPDPEKLSWLVLGRPPSTGGGGDLAVLLPAAQALLGGIGGNMAEGLAHSLGLDSLSVEQSDLVNTGQGIGSRVAGGGSTATNDAGLSGQVLTLGKRLSSDLMLSFEQSLSGAAMLMKLSYQLNRQISVVLRGGADNALDLYYSVSFR